MPHYIEVIVYVYWREADGSVPVHAPVFHCYTDMKVEVEVLFCITARKKI